MKILDQDRAKLLVADYITTLGYGGNSAFYSEFVDFNSNKTISQKALNNWLKEITGEMQAQNFLQLNKFLMSDKFKKVIPWCWDEESIEDRELEAEKFLSKVKKYGKPASLDRLPNTDEIILLDKLDGYWRGYDRSFTQKHTVSWVVGIKLFKENMVANIVLVTFGHENFSLEKGLFTKLYCDPHINRLDCVGLIWRRKNSEERQPFQLTYWENDAGKGGDKCGIKINIPNSTNNKILELAKTDVGGDMKEVIDEQLEGVLPDYEK